MRILLLLCSVSAGSLVAFGQPNLPEGMSCARAKSEMAAMQAALWPSAVPPRDNFSTDVDVLHYQLDIEIDPNAAWIGGSNTMTVQSLVDDLTLFRFRLDTTFTITDMRVGAAAVTWGRVEYPTVEVTLDRPYSTGEQFQLYVAYNGMPDATGTRTMVFRTRNGAPEAYTHSEPWFAYKWWPAKDDLRDKTTADLWFTVPGTMVVASNGALQGTDGLPDDKVRYRWKTTYPTADYLYCIGATNYNQFATTWQYQGHTMPLEFFIYPEDDTPEHREFWLSLAGPLTTFSDLFGVYPFVDEKYGMLEFGGGGMEHQTITSFYDNFSWEDGIVHELAHQWWGDNVTCATWHDIWLNEGFATYCEALWQEFRPGGNDADLHHAMGMRRPREVDGTVYCYDISSVSRIFDPDLSYCKGAWALHMLRHVTGEADFFATLRAYRAAHQGGAATTADFQQIAETVSGRDLAWYFDEWVYRGGAPEYRFGWRPYVVDGVGYVELYVNQIQPATYPVFTMPVDVVVSDAQGAHAHTVWNDARTENLLFQVENPAVSNVGFGSAWVLATSVSPVTFVEGPPKIVASSPAPGAVVPRPALIIMMEVIFHKDVVVHATDFALVGQRTGAQPLLLQYDHVRHAARLWAGARTDTYTLTVRDTIVDTTAQLRLDGELVKPDGPDPFPSGDGVPGGDAVATFYVTQPGDMNCDGTYGYLSFGDINPFVLYLSNFAAWQAMYPGCPAMNGDINGDGTYGHLSFGDINPFVALLSGG